MTIDAPILDAAQRLLNSESGADFTVDQLAAAAGISRATLYRRIGSKEALLQQIAELHGVDPETLGARDIRADSLAAARELFSRYGLVSVTMEQIAQEAGVGVATLYRHFGDKGGLLRAFSDEFRPQQLVSDTAFIPSGDLAADLQPIVSGLLRFMMANGDIFRLTLAERSKELEVIQAMRNTPGRTLHRLTRIFQLPEVADQLAPLEAQELALSLLGMIFGFGFTGPFLYELPLAEPDKVAHTIVRIFLDGVRRSTDTTLDKGL
ncbi:MAG: helix-turn-helix domain-containing protein [Caldilineaceae bacterium]